MNEQLKRRLAFLGILIVGLFAALFTRAWYLQVLTSEELAERALSNYVEIVITQPTRGRILDRHGVVLADNIRSGVITVNQSRYAPGQTDFVLEQLSELINIPVATLKSRLQDQQTHPLAAKVVATGLDEYGLLRVSELSLPGVEAKWVMSRVYPQNEIASHIVGYVGAMSQAQQDRLLQSGYLPSERVGKSGIEQIFEPDLHGQPGRTELEVDSTGRVHRILSQTSPTPGSDVYLSIDADLQAATESYLRQGLIAARKTVSEDSGFFFPAIGGAAVVMDLRNGDVLAMASHPTYDPNWLVAGITTLEYQSVFENPYAPG
ncbi:MAG: penicillin-binding transpeptidase domain-containing protein, partial [Actinomycetota bacterium]|nr:penicillin-binding transpeptidase domain-containing protein [Actinomycetota bacterium]